MALNRREFIELLAAGAGAGLLGACSSNNTSPTALKNGLAYDLPNFGNARLLHITDTHAQLLPIYFREPNVNLGVGPMKGRPPHLVGHYFLKHFGIPEGSQLAHAFTYLDFEEMAHKYGKVGGFAHLATLVNKYRNEFGPANTLLLDGGDTWQGSGTALWTKGEDMVKACNLLGVDVMTGHWEFTYPEDVVLENVKNFKGEFVAQNVIATEEALFDDVPVYDEDTGHVFKPYTIKTLNGRRVAIIGQAFPYTPIANPKRFIPHWTFGIRDNEMQEIVNKVRAEEKVDAVIVLSHNGMDVDLKMASVVSGIDVILGGHTHDGVPKPVLVQNTGGKTLVTNAGSNGKFLGVLDLDIGKGKVNGYRYHLMPIFANLLEADASMQALINDVRKPYEKTLNEKLAVSDELLYRRGNFNGTFDQIICDAQRVVGDAQISLSPGFRWGTTLLPGQDITMERVLDQTAMTYPETYVREMKGSDIKLILEDVCDNLFNKDPYYQQGGDMVRVGGMDYVCEPEADMGKRISHMTLDDGSPIEAGKTYKVAGWATVGSKAPGEPIWDVVATYLRDNREVKIKKLNVPKLKGVKGNPGIEDYPGEILS